MRLGINPVGIPLRVHVPDHEVLGIVVLVGVVQVLGKYMSIGLLGMCRIMAFRLFLGVSGHGFTHFGGPGKYPARLNP